jgi:hypothetical protein
MAAEEQIYVELEGEGTTVRRPVSATPLADGTWLLLGPVPTDEQWPFAPGTIVRCIERSFQGGERGMVAIEAVQA